MEFRTLGLSDPLQDRPRNIILLYKLDPTYLHAYYEQENKEQINIEQDAVAAKEA